MGKANEHFEVGDQFTSAYDGGEITWEIIGIDQDIPTDNNFTHSMTILTRDCLHNIQFDAKEPNNPDSNRENYGNNRYIHSAARQWLNSDEETFQWVSQHDWDAQPTDSLDLYNGAGFLYRLDPELVAVLGKVNKKVAQCNYDNDGSGQDGFSDKVFFLSRKEVGFTDEGIVTGEFTYPYYQGASNADRIKLLGGSAMSWWLRSPSAAYTYAVRRVNTSGSVGDHYVYYSYGVAPACVIV